MKSLREIAKNSFLDTEQLKKIEAIILGHGHYVQSTIRDAIEWFCTALGMDEYYFGTTPLKTIARHIEAVKSAAIIASLKKEKSLTIDLATELKDEAIYLVDDFHNRALEIERHIEKKYPNARLQSYRTSGKALGGRQLRLYQVYKTQFCSETICPEEADLNKISCRLFLKTATAETRKRYQDIINSSMGWETPLIDVSQKSDTKEVRIMVAVSRESNSRFFSNVSDVIDSHGLVSNRKYVEQFANGKTVYSFYLDAIRDDKLIQNLVEDISLVYVIPESPLSELFREGKLSAQETVFGVSAWSFAHQFLSEYNDEYLKLRDHLRDSPELLGLLRTLKTQLAKTAYDETKVWETLVENHNYLKKAYRLFDKKFNPFVKRHEIREEMERLKEDITRNITVEITRDIFLMICSFIDVILRTNFYKYDKTSIAFMYDPRFLNPVDYPNAPYGIFHVIAVECRGFHIRFRDIARGGIRIVRSNNLQTYFNNSDFIFDENYNLALTQQKKNKDIPEGGSKGTILLRWGYQDRPEAAFKKYINGLLDLLLPDKSIIDTYGKEVILFLGPDEGTAEMMEWAALRAKALDYPYWKAFSTGKPVHIGGIPHDLYGMTTNSVHQYVLEILNKRGLKEERITKVMTGGPDGDLGSNEILISKDKMLAIIDGSGVLFDPKGIDRTELRRLAEKRQMVAHFQKKFLSPQGFLVTIEDKNVVLPDGENVISGLEFRNTFHFHPKFQADLFIPCGGRPASININNWTVLIDKKGAPRFKFIVEGANLFLTQDARLRLEEHGVVIYKDASANKGGVTSSSMEVFASLALNDEEYTGLMCVHDDRIPSFRKKYVEEILDLIRENARLEFEIIWRENQNKGIPRSVLSDLISEKINAITDAVYTSNLFENDALFQRVIECCCPEILIRQVGFKAVLERVPLSYLKAIFASRLASRYVYKYGLDANEIHFYTFLQEYR
ncbi:MAG: NAD-glutamate dehydrogenase [Candidatus Aminicenantes bacterium]|nr:NAD-glutamate dehydrogenase [Candidatus Aminicenantes bacterium]